MGESLRGAGSCGPRRGGCSRRPPTRTIPDGFRPFPPPLPALKPILLPFGASEPLVIEPCPGADVVEARGPAGVRGTEARVLAATALDRPPRVPPLESHVVPGDRVAIALSGPLPCPGELLESIRERLGRAGVAPEDVTVVGAPPVAGLDGTAALRGPEEWVTFDPERDGDSSYVAADPDGHPLHVARRLVDADAVVAVGTFTWDAALGGPSLAGELWPAFTRGAARDGVVRLLARRGRGAVEDLRSRALDVAWRMGVMACVRAVPGEGGSLHAVVFDTPAGADRRARREAQGWRPAVDGSADVVVATLSDPHGGLPMLVRAVAAAARAARPGGTICVAGRIAEPPGAVIRRWRQGLPLPDLVREALRSGERDLVADACAARFLARALGERRLVILGDLPGEEVEELGFGHAPGPDAVERLAHRADSLAVLREADRQWPRVGGSAPRTTAGR